MKKRIVFVGPASAAAAAGFKASAGLFGMTYDAVAADVPPAEGPWVAVGDAMPGAVAVWPAAGPWQEPTDKLVAVLLGGKADAPVLPPPPPAKVPRLVAKLSRETAGRRGKEVTIVEIAAMLPTALKDLAADLKSKCGAGGGVVEGRIEIQGDHREKLRAALTAKNFTVKG